MNNENFYAGRPGLPRREFFPDIAGPGAFIGRKIR